jgi:hypothetical protein
MMCGGSALSKTLAPKRKILGGLRSLSGALFRVYYFEIKGNDTGGTTWDTREMHDKYLLENLKGRSYLEDQGVDSSVNTETGLKQTGWNGRD